MSCINKIYDFYNAQASTALPDPILTEFYIAYIPDILTFSNAFHDKIEKTINLNLKGIIIEDK